MRISLRTALLLILAIAVGLGYYEYKRPRRIRIVGAMAKVHEHELPEFALRYRDGKRIKEAIQQAKSASTSASVPQPLFDTRYRILVSDLNRFHENWNVHATDDDVVRTHKQEFVSKARERLDDSRPFRDVETAFTILWVNGHADEAIDYLTARYLKRLPADPKVIDDWPFAKVDLSIDESKRLATNKEFFAELIRQAELGTLPIQYQSLLARAGRPEYGLRPLFRKLHTGNTFRASVAESILNWAKAHECDLTACEEAFQFVLNTCKSKQTLVQIRLDIASSFYGMAKESHPGEAESIQQMVREIHQSLPKNDNSALQVLAKIADEGDADFFRAMIADPKPKAQNAEGLRIAISTLRRIGCAKETEHAIIKLVESRKLDQEFYREYAAIRGKAAIPFFKTRIDELVNTQPDYFDLLTVSAAIELLANLHAGSKDAETIQYLRETFARICEAGGEEAYSRAHSIVLALKTVGDAEADELWNKMPLPIDCDASDMQLHWLQNPTLKASDLVAFLNESFPVGTPIKDEELPQSDVDHWDVLELLTKRGMARCIDAGLYSGGIDRMVRDIWQLVDEDEGFELRAAVYTDELKLVIDNRLYTLLLLSDGGFSYPDSALMIDILNPLIASHGATKRFFVFHSGDSDYERYIVYVEPQVIKELQEKFGMQVLDGCEYYFEH